MDMEIEKRGGLGNIIVLPGSRSESESALEKEDPKNQKSGGDTGLLYSTSTVRGNML
jgi:hypothetical protein